MFILLSLNKDRKEETLKYMCIPSIRALVACACKMAEPLQEPITTCLAGCDKPTTEPPASLEYLHKL